jgi:hypothetical protein
VAYLKGESGNVLGRPVGTKSQRTLLKSRAQEAFAVLEGVMLDPSADTSNRIEAATAILSASQQSVAS